MTVVQVSGAAHISHPQHIVCNELIVGIRNEGPLTEATYVFHLVATKVSGRDIPVTIKRDVANALAAHPHQGYQAEDGPRRGDVQVVPDHCAANGLREVHLEARRSVKMSKSAGPQER